MLLVEAGALNCVGRLQDQRSFDPAGISSVDGLLRGSRRRCRNCDSERTYLASGCWSSSPSRSRPFVHRGCWGRTPHEGWRRRSAPDPSRQFRPRDGICVGTADPIALGIAQVHGVFHRCSHLRGGVRGVTLRPMKSSSRGRKARPGGASLQMTIKAFLCDVGAEVGIGAEEVEGAMNAVFDRADAQPPLAVTCSCPCTSPARGSRAPRLPLLRRTPLLCGRFGGRRPPDEELLGGVH
ncbi:hypothetical protein [Acetomicrobium sp.]|uniref:hypothetical protein n=1 Tax=Acetomicrobium sp. TaxID=1872099 RepID=UPI002871CE2F|nr:hypothetical protein [Acetomicrobium sp.]MDR9768826.1 hypothetical protein [Acetomicrobium sp.]